MALLALVWLTTSRLTAWPCGSNPAQAKRVAHVSLGSRYLAIMLCARLPPAGLHLRATDGTLSYLGACFELTQGTAPWPCHCVGINLNPSAYFAYPWAQIADSQICDRALAIKLPRIFIPSLPSFFHPRFSLACPTYVISDTVAIIPRLLFFFIFSSYILLQRSCPSLWFQFKFK